jgi:Na+:H+ antiporter
MSDVLVVLPAFLAVIVASAIISQKAKVPYTLVLVFIGISFTALSALALLGGNPLATDLDALVSQMNSAYTQLVGGGVFVGLVVPPLIFAAMIHVRAVDLRAVARPSILLATLGVVVSTVVGGLLIWQLAGLSLLVSLLIAAVISPTDVVTVLEVFRRVRVPSELSALMDLEAALNDATAIAVFTVIVGSTSVTNFQFLNSVLGFIGKLGGGAIIGLTAGFAAEAVSSIIVDRIAVTILTISAVYGTYAVATGIGVSGLVAVAVVGLYFGNLTLKAAVGPGTREAVAIFWEVAAFLGTSVAFLFIGFQVDLGVLVRSIFLILIAYAAISVARALSVYPTFAIFNWLGDKWPITWSNVAMLGGMRGALSIALAASVAVSTTVSASDSQTVVSVVLGVVFLSLTVQVPLLYRYVKRRFQREQKISSEELHKKISEAMGSVQASQKERMDGVITDEEFVAQLEGVRDELNEVLGELASSIETQKLLRARASHLFSAMVRRRFERRKSEAKPPEEGDKAPEA